MTLGVIGRQNLDELQELVVGLFSQVPDKQVPENVWPEHPYEGTEHGVKVYVVPVKEQRQVTYYWPVGDYTSLYRSSPGQHISHLIGHEGSGSLLSELKRLGWANSLIASCSPSATGFGFLIIYTDLTEQGLENVDEVTALVFQFIRLIKEEGVLERIFRERQAIREMTFRFKDKLGPLSAVKSAVSYLKNYPMEEVLTAGQLLTDWRPEQINDILGLVTPEKCKMMVIGKVFESICTESEEWYNAKYHVEKINEETLRDWGSRPPHHNLHIPEPNQFIPSNFDLHDLESDLQLATRPRIIHTSDLGRLWFKQDREFLLPKTYVNFTLQNPISVSSPLNVCFMNIFLDVIEDNLNELAYSARLAGASFDVSMHVDGLDVLVIGYSEKLSILLHELLNTIFHLKIDSTRFCNLLERYKRSLENFEADQPSSHASFFMTSCTIEKKFLPSEKLAVLSHVTPEGVQEYARHFLSHQFVESFVFGNCSLETAKNFHNQVEEVLREAGSIPLPATALRKTRELLLPDGSHHVFTRYNIHHPTSAVMTLLQCYQEPSIEADVIISLLAQILKEPAFNQLRTQEQLGYIVSLADSGHHCSRGLRVLVQSDRHPEALEERVEVFLKDAASHLSELEPEVFETHKQSLEAKITEKPRTMGEQFSDYMSEISSRLYMFDRTDKEVEYLRSLKLEDILKVYSDFVSSAAERRRKISVHIVSQSAHGDKVKNASSPTPKLSPDYPGVRITSIPEFRNMLPLAALPAAAMEFNELCQI